MFNPLLQLIRDYYKTETFIPLHAPVFYGNERQYVLDALDSTFVSSVGQYVDRFEKQMAEYTGSPAAVVTVNGTSALHLALILAQVQPQDYVITQALTFVATCNAISYCQATPIFVDVDKKRMSLCPQALDAWLDAFAYRDDAGVCRYREDNRVIRACIPMHTFGHPAKMDELISVCSRWNLVLIEDAAESLGSYYNGKHTGTLGEMGVLSFNGNKILTTGGGGMILTHEHLAKRGKHLSTTAKKPHPYEFIHDEIGYNYRMPNLNAALGCAQLEKLNDFIEKKRHLAKTYAEFFQKSSFEFVKEPCDSRSNYWLNAIICEDKQQRDDLLKTSNAAGVMMRPIWQPMPDLAMFAHAPADDLTNTQYLAEHVINLPSSVTPIGDKHA